MSVSLSYSHEGKATFKLYLGFYRPFCLRYPYFPATDDTVALSHIGELLGLAGLREAATSLGRKLTIAGLKETSFTVQQIVRKQRNSSKNPTETGNKQH